MDPIPGDPRPGPEDNDRPPDLQQVEAALQSLHIGSNDAALSTLAAGSKEYPDVRTRLATPDILRTLVEVVECGLNDSLETTTAALRCIGNACIDNDSARGAIAQLGFSWAVLCLRHDNDEIKWLTIKVLYNVCSDHEAAQRQCYHDRVYVPLISICASPLALHSEDKGTLIDLLFWITGHNASLPADNLDSISDDTVLELLMLPYYHYKNAVVEDFATLVEICLTFLRDPVVQKQVIQFRWVACVWQMFVDSENRMRQRWTGEDVKETKETKELLKPLSTSLIWCLSDLAANEAFAQQYCLDDDFLEHLLTLIASGRGDGGPTWRDAVEREGLDARHFTEARAIRTEDADHDNERYSARSIAAACQVVGNLLRVLLSEDVATLVMERRIHEKLWEILAAGDAADYDDDVPHSFAGFLVQLTRPSVEVRERLASGAGAYEALTMLCEHKTPQIKQDGMRLLRALGKDCPVNQQRFWDLASRVRPEGGGDTAMRVEAAPT
ncbi:hypothetical protein B0A55_02641 [Friedmanniomyces simplex]|uniref:Ataxin-10 domain-containing protein n=1 Tax=Friedmanniomyces simplex TaxID=329884 RepID=A0A4V5NGH3_9PEZI|nr:hypothetical protein B0A55_02641 [Friedmanniomyces simplex]